MHPDMGMDEMQRNPDGSITAIQYTRTIQYPRTSVRMDPAISWCTAPNALASTAVPRAYLRASNLTAAASGAYFGDINLTNTTVGDPREFVRPLWMIVCFYGARPAAAAVAPPG